MNIYELHERMTGHLFPAYSNTDERFLSLALCGEVAELMENIGGSKDHEDYEDDRDELADCRVYLELLAKCFGIEGDKLEFDRERARCRALNIISPMEHATTSLCVNAGLLANLIKKRWRDGIHPPESDSVCRSRIGMVREAVEIVAWCLGIEGDKLDARVEQKLLKVVEKHKARLESRDDGLKKTGEFLRSHDR